MDNEVKITVKWNGEEHSISEIQENDTVLILKEKIHKVTGVRPERQKLLNLKLKGYLIFIKVKINKNVIT